MSESANLKADEGLVDRVKVTALSGFRFARFIVGRMQEDQVNRVAASLSYTSTLALVPALALALAILAAFPAFAEVRESVLDFILNNFVPDTQLSMTDALTGFVAAAGELTTIGILGLIVTSVMLLLTIEGAFNRIYRVLRPRPILARLAVFWTVITISPLLLGLSFSLSGYFLTLRRFVGEEETGPVSVLLGAAMPTLITAAAFALIFAAVPNRRVRLPDAIIGGVIAALLFALLRFGFTAFVASMQTYQTLYGAVAALPVFLIWLFLSWLVILAGAEVTAALHDWRRLEHELQTGPGGRLALAMDILSALYDAAGSGAGLQQQALRNNLEIKEAALIPVLEELRAGSFISLGEDGVWRLGRDLSRTPVSELVHYLGYGVPIAPHLEGQHNSVGRLGQLMSEAQETENNVLQSTIASLIETPDLTPERDGRVARPQVAVG